MFHALFALVNALFAHTGHLVHATRVPVHHVPAPAPATGTRQATAALLRLVHAHGGHVVRTFTYGYGPKGQHTALNGGVVVDLGGGRCVGRELYGHPGMFGNVYGFTGGDCS